MTNDPKDRHVLAAAIASSAELVVTFNLRDFRAEACQPYGIDALHPDQFLVDLYDLEAETVEAEITAQAAALQRPPITRSVLIRMLEHAGVPRFADRLLEAVVAS